MEQLPEEMSPNEIVAYRLKRAREEIRPRLTQDKAAEKLRNYLGRAWSRGTYSNAERYTGDRVRHFTPEDLYAFSQVFGKPLWWFLLPPPGVRVAGTGETSQLDLSGPQAFELIFGTPTHELFEHVRDVLREAPESARTVFQERVRQITKGIVLEVASEDKIHELISSVDDRLRRAISREADKVLRPAADEAQTRVKAIERLQATEDRLRDTLRRASGKPLSEDDIERQVAQFRQSVGEIPTAKESGEVESPRRGEETRR